MTSSLKIASVEILTNVKDKNKMIDLLKEENEPFGLTKFQPLVLDQEFFVNANDDLTHI